VEHIDIYEEQEYEEVLKLVHMSNDVSEDLT
jgi:hypothetical protein